MRLNNLLIVVAMALLLTSCNRATKNSTNDASEAEEAKSLNDIRFGNWTDDDWRDNEYIWAIRHYIDDYCNGKVADSKLDDYRGIVCGQFVVGEAEPFLLGGLFFKLIFLNDPDKMFEAWVYSEVDEESETVTSYAVRSIRYKEDGSGFTKEEILKINEEHPELRIW